MMTPYRFSVVNGRMQFSNGVEVGDVVLEVDGYYVLYFDQPGRGGCFSSGDLISMGRALEELNRDWDEEVKRYFSDK